MKAPIVDVVLPAQSGGEIEDIFIDGRRIPNVRRVVIESSANAGTKVQLELTQVTVRALTETPNVQSRRSQT